MSVSKKISIDRIHEIQGDEKTRRTVILAENGGHEIELSITEKQLKRLVGYVVVRDFEAAVAEYHRNKRGQSKTA